MTGERGNEIINSELSSVDQNKKIFIGGLDSKWDFFLLNLFKSLFFYSFLSTDKQTILNYVEQFGKTIKCTLMRTTEGKSQGCADVIFEGKHWISIMNIIYVVYVYHLLKSLWVNNHIQLIIIKYLWSCSGQSCRPGLVTGRRLVACQARPPGQAELWNFNLAWSVL